MKNISFAFFLVYFLFSSCCFKESEETARYELADEELSLIPYQQGQQIPFIHSGGYAFDFIVVEDKLAWREYHPFCEWRCCGNDYYSYQVRSTVLESAYPNLRITLSLGGTSFSDYEPYILNMDINNRHFIALPYDSTFHFAHDFISRAVFYDSVEINNKIFRNVTGKSFDSHYFIQDSTVLVPESILYNELGLLYIRMNNDETYSLNE